MKLAWGKRASANRRFWQELPSMNIDSPSTVIFVKALRPESEICKGLEHRSTNDRSLPAEWPVRLAPDSDGLKPLSSARLPNTREFEV